jgi:hypothetical protein
LTCPSWGSSSRGPGGPAAHPNKKLWGLSAPAGTIASGAYEEAIKARTPGSGSSAGLPPFRPHRGKQPGPIPRSLPGGGGIPEPLKEAGVDTLILGCTHYPLTGSYPSEVMGEGVKLVSSAQETARETREILKSQNLLNPDPPGGRVPTGGHRFYSSGPPGPLRRSAKTSSPENQSLPGPFLIAFFWHILPRLSIHNSISLWTRRGIILWAKNICGAFDLFFGCLCYLLFSAMGDFLNGDDNGRNRSRPKTGEPAPPM